MNRQTLDQVKGVADAHRAEILQQAQARQLIRQRSKNPSRCSIRGVGRLLNRFSRPRVDAVPGAPQVKEGR